MNKPETASISTRHAKFFVKNVVAQQRHMFFHRKLFVVLEHKRLANHIVDVLTVSITPDIAGLQLA